MKSITLMALFATLLCLNVQAQNPNNLLDGFNPGFEGFDANDPAYWWNTQIDSSSTARGKITYTTVNAKEGTRCARAEIIAASPATPWHAQLIQFSQFFSLKQLKTNNIDTQFYTIRFWARADSAGRKCNVLIQKGAPNYETPFQETVTLTTGWVQYNFKFKAPTGDYHPVFHFALEKGIFFVDYIELGKFGELDGVVVTNPNLMNQANPSFETFTATDPAPNWFTQIDSTGTNTARGTISYVTTGAQDGTRALKATVTAVTANSPWHIQAVNTSFQPLKKLKTGTTTNQSWSVTFWAKSETAGKKINAIVQNAAYATVAVPEQQQFTLTTSWAKYTYTFTVTADDNLRPAIQMGVDAGVYYLDNFAMGKTEEITGVRDFEIRNDMVVMPNPTTSTFFIKNDQVFENVELYDIAGRMVQHFNGNTANQYNINELAKGVYQIVAKSKKVMFTTKLVKM